MENTIEVDGKRYDLSQISPAAAELVQMTQFAQGEAQRKSIEARLANIALQAAFTNLRVAMASEPTYTPSVEEEAVVVPSATSPAVTN
jgi:hypothetical protein